jgi:hypothetical protein
MKVLVTGGRYPQGSAVFKTTNIQAEVIAQDDNGMRVRLDDSANPEMWIELVIYPESGREKQDGYDPEWCETRYP